MQTPTSLSTPASAIKVRTAVRAGAWQCNDCNGKIMGNQLFKANCSYCQK